MTTPSPVRLTKAQQQTLTVLAAHYDHEANCLYFKTIAAETRLAVKDVRRAVRALARKGFAKYERGLFDDEGMVAGSGYSCTGAGIAALKESGT